MMEAWCPGAAPGQAHSPLPQAFPTVRHEDHYTQTRDDVEELDHRMLGHLSALDLMTHGTSHHPQIPKIMRPILGSSM